VKYLRKSFSVAACEQSVSQADWDEIFRPKCDVHPKYEAKRKPMADCAPRREIWDAKEGIGS